MNRKVFQANTTRPTVSSLADIVARAQQGDASARSELCATLAWVAFANPESTQYVYDHIANSWLNTGESLSNALKPTPDCTLNDEFWSAFWSMIDDAEKGYDATSITLRAAGLGGFVDQAFGIRAEAAACDHAGVRTPEKKAIPGVISFDTLSRLPENSLGRELHDMWVTNNFDPEVLDRNAIGLSALPPALNYLNTRILQMHDVWHLMAGYETTALHEVAISSFQLAQFGHNYSAMFLASSLTISANRSPEGFALLMHVVSEAWQHGRRSPNLMDIEWEDCWNKSTQALRQEFGIRPFESAFPADTIEQAMANL